MVWNTAVSYCIIALYYVYTYTYINLSYVVRLLIHAIHQGHADSGSVMMGSLPNRKPDKHAGKQTIGQIMDRQSQRQTHIRDSYSRTGRRGNKHLNKNLECGQKHWGRPIDIESLCPLTDMQADKQANKHKSEKLESMYV